MNKKNKKFFSIFWLIVGLIWIIAIIRHAIVKDGITEIIIYVIAAMVSFVLASIYYKNFVR
jgi:hypothetical protein